MYNCILNSLEKKKISCVLFCDFSKAFDKVWHEGLIHKIKSYGVDSNILNWFSSYLHGRQQRVLINNSSSSLCNVSAGVPQISVLSPLTIHPALSNRDQSQFLSVIHHGWNS
jgi:hypothetical protein